MDSVVEALRDQLDELNDLVVDLDDSQWNLPSACPGWAVADVLVHLAQTNEVAIASAEHRGDDVLALFASDDGDATVDDLVAAAVSADERRDNTELYAWWKQTADGMVAAFDAVDPAERVQWVVGDMAARTLCTTRLSETWIHTTDIAHGLGFAVLPTERLWHIARLVHRTIPYSFQRVGRDLSGSVRFELDAPDETVWNFGSDDAAIVVTGTALDLCTVAGQRAGAADTTLTATGPDGSDVLELVRTFA